MSLKVTLIAALQNSLARNGIQASGTELGPVADELARAIARDPNFVSDLEELQSLLPKITTQPQSQAIHAGETATFSVAASGDEPLAYQWHEDGVDIPDATWPSYTTEEMAASHEDTEFSVTVSNSTGTVKSNTATLMVTPAPPAGQPKPVTPEPPVIPPAPPAPATPVTETPQQEPAKNV